MAKPAIPSLSHHQSRLLQAYFRARCDIFLLAENEHLPVTDLIAWSQSPAIKAHLAALKELADNSTHLRTSQARLLALDKLEHIVKTTDDPQELRRAASTIYRGGCAMPQPRAPKNPDPDKPPRPYIPSSYRRKWPILGPGFDPAYKPPRPTPHDSFVTQTRNAHPPPPGEVPRLCEAEGAPSPRSSLPTLREPKTSPSRNNSRRRRARRIISRTSAHATPIPRKPRTRKPTPAPPSARPRSPRQVRSRRPRRANFKGRGPPLSR